MPKKLGDMETKVAFSRSTIANVHCDHKNVVKTTNLRQQCDQENSWVDLNIVGAQTLFNAIGNRRGNLPYISQKFNSEA